MTLYSLRLSYRTKVARSLEKCCVSKIRKTWKKIRSFYAEFRNSVSKFLGFGIQMKSLISVTILQPSTLIKQKKSHNHFLYKFLEILTVSTTQIAFWNQRQDCSAKSGRNKTRIFGQKSELKLNISWQLKIDKTYS